MSCLRAACLQFVSPSQLACVSVSVPRCVSLCVCVFSAIKNAALPAQDAATCHTSSLLSARLCRLSPAAFYFIVCCCRNSWSVKGLYLPPPPFSAPLAPLVPFFISPLHIPVGYWTAAAATEAGAAPRLRLVVYVDFGVALINMQRYCKRTKRAKPKTNERKQKIVGKISKKQKATNDAMSKFLPWHPTSSYPPLATGRVNI